MERCPRGRHPRQLKLQSLDEIAEIIQALAGLLYRFGLWNPGKQIFDAVIIRGAKPAPKVNPVIKGKSGNHIRRKISGDNGGDGYVLILKVFVFTAAVIGLQIIVRYNDHRARCPAAGMAYPFIPVFGWADFKAVKPDVAIISDQQS